MGESMGDRNEVRITLSRKAMEEFQKVADWTGVPLGTMLRQHLEEYHRSPEFNAVLERVEADNKADERSDSDTGDG